MNESELCKQCQMFKARSKHIQNYQRQSSPTTPHPIAPNIAKMASSAAQGKKLCTNFTIGTCSYGHNCKYRHADNLNPDVLDESGWEPPPDETCARCANKALRCDKAGRDPGPEDPCSECRHFAGDKAKCVRQSAVTMNYAQWQLFMSREKQEFTLPAFRPRDETIISRSARPSFVPQAMASDKIRPDWRGATREALLATPDLLTEDIRRHPRRYFHPPGQSTVKAKASAKNEMILGQLGQTEFDRRKAEGTLHDRSKTPRASAAVPPSPAFANFPPALEGRPLLLGVGGSYPAETMTWSYVNHSWATAWSGNLLPGKHTSGRLPPSLKFRPEPHAQSGEAVSATWSYDTRRWKITWADDFSMESARFGENTQVVYTSVPQMAHILTRNAQPRTSPQLSPLPVQQASVTETDDLADKHSNKKRIRDEDDDLADEDHDKKRLCD